MTVPAGRFKILHVDDFDEFLDDFRELFSSKFDITSVQSSIEGLQRLEEQAFDAVIVDFDMPDMDGLGFLAAAKARWPLLPVVFCTGQGSEEVARAALTAGASDYFRKDFESAMDREKMVNAVRHAIERRTMEQALNRERDRLEKIIQLNPYSIQMVDREGHMATWNPASLDLFKAIPGKEWCAWTDPNLLANGYAPLLERARQGEAVSFPLIAYNPARVAPHFPDHEVWVAAVAFPLVDEDGQFDGLVTMHEDVTARVNAEEALKAALTALQESHDKLEARVEARTAELGEANRQLGEANLQLQAQAQTRERLQAELVRRNRELEGFSARVSHDLRNELLALKRTFELVAEDPQVRKRSAGILERYDHLISFVENLLNLARTGKVISRRVDIPAAPILAEVFARLRPPGKEAELRPPHSDAVIPGDPVGIEQVLSNLVSNSFQYADPAKDKVTIEMHVKARAVDVEVRYRDNGVGIPRDNLDRVFDISFTTDRTNHFGLGLAFVKKVIEAHGGSVRVESAGRGLGTEFVLTLPKKKTR